MRQGVRFAAAAAFGLILSEPASASPLDEGRAAFADGRYEAALQLF